MLILGLSANFILDFLHFPIKTILLNEQLQKLVTNPGTNLC